MPQDPPTRPSLLVVIAVYQCTLAESQSARSLLQILSRHPALAQQISLLIYDNSPQSQDPAATASFPGRYVHDPANSGLAAAYNHALNLASTEGHTWLLLLDQDTVLTDSYASELVNVAGELHAELSVAAIVPKLVVQGVVHSPALPFVKLMRGQFGRRPAPLALNATGIQSQSLFPYNSGAAVRVSALQAIGGFPAEYWLDFLDHAVFQKLFSAGYRMYVLRAALEHDSSYANPCSLPLWRFENVLTSQARFLHQEGTFLDRWLYRVWLLRHSRSLRRSCADPLLGQVALRYALRLTPSKPQVSGARI